MRNELLRNELVVMMTKQHPELFVNLVKEKHGKITLVYTEEEEEALKSLDNYLKELYVKQDYKDIFIDLSTAGLFHNLSTGTKDIDRKITYLIKGYLLSSVSELLFLCAILFEAKEGNYHRTYLQFLNYFIIARDKFTSDQKQNFIENNNLLLQDINLSPADAYSLALRETKEFLN